jgi:hypothetical protein
VDVRGPEQWLLDLVCLEEMGYWRALKSPPDPNDGVEMKWFDEPLPEGKWLPLKITSKALGHLILVRMASEVLRSFGLDAPSKVGVSRLAPTGTAFTIRLTA